MNRKVGKWAFLNTFCICLGVWGIEVQTGFGRPCPHVRKDIMTPHHFFITAPAHPQATWVAGKNQGDMLSFWKEASTLETCCSLTNLAEGPKLDSFLVADTHLYKVRQSVGPSVTLELSRSSRKRKKRVFMMSKLRSSAQFVKRSEAYKVRGQFFFFSKEVTTLKDCCS